MSEPNKTIAQKTKDLSDLVDWFDSDDFSLEESIEKFKKAEKLAVEIEKDLINLKNEINIIKKKFDSES